MKFSTFKSLAIISACLFAGVASAKKRSCHHEEWPWAKEWKCAEVITVTNTRASGKGSFSWACKKANKSNCRVHIKFCIPKCDKGYNSDRGSWVIKASEECIINNRVWIDGFSQPGSRPNTNKPCKPNNACWTIEFEGPSEESAANAKAAAFPRRFFLNFDEESDGSIATGFAAYNLDGVAKIKSRDTILAGLATGTDSTGNVSKPVTVAVSVEESAVNTRLGLLNSRFASSIWGGRGGLNVSLNDSSEAFDPECFGAFTSRGRNTQIFGGTLNLRRNGFQALSDLAEYGVCITGDQASTVEEPTARVSGLTAAGFSEVTVDVMDPVDVQVVDTSVNLDITRQALVEARAMSRAAFRVRNSQLFNADDKAIAEPAGFFSLRNSYAVNELDGLVAGDLLSRKLARVELIGNVFGADASQITAIPNAAGAGFTNIKELLVKGGRFSSARGDIALATAAFGRSGHGVYIGQEITDAVVDTIAGSPVGGELEFGSDTGIVVENTGENNTTTVSGASTQNRVGFQACTGVVNCTCPGFSPVDNIEANVVIGRCQEL